MNRNSTRSAIYALIGLILMAADSSFAEDLFRDQIAPIFRARCLSCHGGAEPQGGLSLQTGEAILGGAYIEPGNAAASQLVELVTPTAGSAAMPKDADPLNAGEIAAIADWVNSGAVWPVGMTLESAHSNSFDWWCYRPLRRPAVPQAVDAAWARSPIDKFVLRQLKRAGLTYSEPADRRTLIRRVSYDLTGLPPSAEEVELFVQDPDPWAYEQLVEQLLNSKRYGERWARHWLDVVKYADTHGYDKDKLRPHAWPYRDYVIRSLNEDKPYSRFVHEQIAGDVLFPGEPDGILGLGFIAAGPWDFIGHVEVPESKIDGKVARNLDRDDMVSNAMNTFCSVTVQCARCHDHKFDPVTQAHYYGLQSLFAAVDRADRAYRVDADVEQQRQQWTSHLAELQQQAQDLAEDPAAGGEQPRQAEPRAALQQAIEDVQAQLAGLPEPMVVFAAATDFAPQGNFKPTAGKFRTIHLLHRGNVQQPRSPAEPGLLPLGWATDHRIDPSAGDGRRRAALAEWLTRKDHPLVWRSIVNRIWQYHFGRGIVATPNDFGRMGEQPTHPELLDWLAVEFRDSGQSLKSLHRLIVTSNTYRQSSHHNAANAQIDGSNRYLWRANRRRLEAEEIRDSILAVSGALDPTMGGPGFYLFELEKTEHSPHFEYHKFDPADVASHRRSIYRFIVRSQPDPWMSTLDCADSSQSTPRRNETLTSLQALSLLNNRFNLVMADRFAARAREEADNLESQVKRATAVALQRPATAMEHQELLGYAESHGLSNLCRLLFNLSEFVFVD